ncbi:hypothetical protein D3C85_1027500 [compost metagenome]
MFTLELMRKSFLLNQSEPKLNSTPRFTKAPALILLLFAPTVGSKSVVASKSLFSLRYTSMLPRNLLLNKL